MIATHLIERRALMRWPDGQTPCPLVVYSHGLGGNREGGDVWGQAWQQAGIAVLHVQHPGSDDRLWRDAQGRAPSEILAAMRHGATPAQLLARVAGRFKVQHMVRALHRGGVGITRFVKKVKQHRGSGEVKCKE